MWSFLLYGIMLLMNKETLEQLKSEAEQKWNDLQEELKRLQGEHRILTKLIEEWVEPKTKEESNATNTTKK